MNPNNVKPGKFYSIFKVHKPHTEGEVSPVRPIVSGCGSMFENVGIFVNHHIKDLATKHSTFLQDTPDFLRHIKKLNDEQTIPDSAVLVTIDAIGCYMNIPQDEGVQSVENILETRNNKEVPSGLFTRLLELILKYNIFILDKDLYQQQVGTAMGTKPAPAYANINLAENIDPKIIELAKKYMVNGEMPIKLLKRFLDDLFMVWMGSVSRLHMFFNEMNEIHDKLKFTMSHTSPQVYQGECSCPENKAIPFLDTLCQIKSGKIQTDL